MKNDLATALNLDEPFDIDLEEPEHDLELEVIETEDIGKGLRTVLQNCNASLGKEETNRLFLKALQDIIAEAKAAK